MRHLPLLLLLLGSSLLLPAQKDTLSLSEDERLYGLARFWKEVSINFAFFDQVPKLDWDSLYLDHIPKVKAAASDYEYARLLQGMCAQLKDGHTRTYLPRHLGRLQNRPAIYTDLIEGKVYVTRILNDTVAAQGVERGMEILEIDGQPVHDYAAAHVRPYCFASTPQDLAVKVYRQYLLLHWADRPVRLKLKGQDGNTIERTLSRQLVRHHPPSTMMSYEQDADGIGVLTINQFWGEEFQLTFDSLVPLLMESKALIVDIRKNSGGNSGNSIYVLQHLSDRPFYTSNWSTPVYNAAYASWGWEQEWYAEDGELIEPSSDISPYSKPVVVLVGPRTYSAAEDFCSYYQQADIGPMIGSKTAGSTGNPIGVNLVKDFWGQICTKKDVFYDGTEFVGYGVEPDIEVFQSAEDFWREVDTVLNYGKQYLREQLAAAR